MFEIYFVSGGDEGAAARGGSAGRPGDLLQGGEAGHQPAVRGPFAAGGLKKKLRARKGCETFLFNWACCRLLEKC